MTTTKKEANKYFEGVGRRKSAIARVRLTPKKGETTFNVEDQKVEEYLDTKQMVQTVLAPLEAVGIKKDYVVTVHIKGGGKSGQADAVQLGLSRALVKFNEDFQRTLRDLDYLKRDPRKKERKKPGLKKARRAPQWSKR